MHGWNIDGDFLTFNGERVARLMSGGSRILPFCEASSYVLGRIAAACGTTLNVVVRASNLGGWIYARANVARVGLAEWLNAPTLVASAVVPG